MDEFEQYRKEKVQAVKAMLEVLAKKNLFDIDLSFVDYDTTVHEIINHEEADFAEVDTLEGMHLAEMKGLLRAVYLNGEPVFCFDDLAVRQEQNKAIRKMADGGDDNVSFSSEDGPASRGKRQKKRHDMVVSMDQISVGQWLMIYMDNQPSSLVKVIEVPSGGRIFFYREWGKTLGVKEAGWKATGMFRATDLGIRPYARGVWEMANWAELVDDQDHSEEI